MIKIFLGFFSNKFTGDNGKIIESKTLASICVSMFLRDPGRPDVLARCPRWRIEAELSWPYLEEDGLSLLYSIMKVQVPDQLDRFMGK